MGSKPVHLKVFIDKKKQKVMFAEAKQDFVEILLSFFTLPLGTIARHSRVSKDIKVGSLDALYESVENLDNKLFYNEDCKFALINPFSSSLPKCGGLKMNLNNMAPVAACVSAGDLVFLKKNTSFIIADDLNVMPCLLESSTLESSIALLQSLGVEYINLLEEKTIDFGLEEFINLLKLSLVTNTPLTNLVLGDSKSCSKSYFCSCSSCIKPSTKNNLPLNASHSTQCQTVKLLIQKSKKKILCAQVGNFFVEMLFSFLTIPLGHVMRLTMDNSPPTGIDNLYNSISTLGAEKYLRSEEIENLLLCPKVASTYLRVTDLLPVYEKDTKQGSFLKSQGTFIVSDDLEVTVSSSMSIITKYNTLGIPVGDIEVMEVSIGEQEALLILKASLTSASPLSDCFNSFKDAKLLI